VPGLYYQESHTCCRQLQIVCDFAVSQPQKWLLLKEVVAAFTNA